MKTLVCSLVLVLSLALSALAGETSYLVATRDVEIPGVGTLEAGGVEKIVADSGEAWVVLSDDGRQISIPKAACRVLNAEQAVEASAVYVQRLLTRMSKLWDIVEKYEAALAEGATQSPHDRYVSKRLANQEEARANAEVTAQFQQARELEKLRRAVEDLRRRP